MVQVEAGGPGTQVQPPRPGCWAFWPEANTRLSCLGSSDPLALPSASESCTVTSKQN